MVSTKSFFKIVVLCIILWCTVRIYSYSDTPSCRPFMRLQGPTAVEPAISNENRVVVVGDVHGEADGLLEVLETAGLIESSSARSRNCVWRTDTRNVTLIQMGDIVDRGPYSLLAFECIESLQKSQSSGNRVVRLLGNHELLWLEGITDYRNKVSDTPAVVEAVTSRLRSAVLRGDVVGAYAHWVAGIPILFSHAGLRPSMIQQLLMSTSRKTPQVRGVDPVISNNHLYFFESLINSKVLEVIEECAYSRPPCHFKHEIFQAGPERGGLGIGGSFWTDFEVLKKAALGAADSPAFLQVVGHSLEVNKIRSTASFSAVCVDAGMYLGGRAYLEIQSNGRFWVHQKVRAPVTAPAAPLQPVSAHWTSSDLTAQMCS